MHLGGVFTWFRSGSLPLSSISIHKHSEGGSTTPRHSTIVVDVSIHYVCNLYVCMYVCIHERVSAYTLLYAVYNCLNSCLLFVRNKCWYVCITVSCDIYWTVHNFPSIWAQPPSKKGTGSPYSNTERRVPEMIPVLGSQPAGDVSHKLGGRLPLLSATPAVILATLKAAATNFAAWWQRHNGCEQFA